VEPNGAPKGFGACASGRRIARMRTSGGRPEMRDKSAGQPICATDSYVARRARHREVPSETGGVCGRAFRGKAVLVTIAKTKVTRGCGAERPAGFIKLPPKATHT